MVDQFITIGSGHGGAPQWWTDLAEMTVTRRGPAAGMFGVAPPGIGLSEFNDLMISWCSGAYDELRQRFYVVLGAGHTNYHDRGTYYYDLLAEIWVALTRPRSFGLASEVGDGSTGICTDGSPLDTHTYNNVVCHPDGRVFVLSMGSVGVLNGVGAPRAWVLNPEGLSQATPAPFGWTDLGLNTLAGTNDVGASAYDYVSDRLIYAKQQPGGGTQASVATWNPTTLARSQWTLASSSSFGTSGEDMVAVTLNDGAGNSVWMGKGNGVNGRPIACLNIQSLLAGSGVFQIPTWTGAVQPVGKCAIHYNPDTAQLWTWRQGTNQLIVADRPANMMAGPYDWFLVDLAGLTITAPSGTAENKINGTFRRCEQIRMPGLRRGGFIINEVDEQVHMWKFPITKLVAS